jgi:hypothetical protein
MQQQIIEQNQKTIERMRREVEEMKEDVDALLHNKRLKNRNRSNNFWDELFGRKKDKKQQTR